MTIDRDGELAPAVQAGLAAVLAAGLAGVVLFTASAQDWARALGGSLMVAGGCVVAGGLLGFLFGIPKVLTSGAAAHPDDLQSTSTSSYAPNTNLEQVSDWLTKILLGAGLTQLVTLPHRLRQLGDALAPLVGGGAGAAQFAAALAVYFAVVGFVSGWLLTRLRMARALTVADRETLADSVNQTAVAAGSLSEAGIGPEQVRTMFDTGVQGLRIQALALLKGRPDTGAVDLILRALHDSLSSFELLQALQAARAVLDADGLTPDQLAEIRTAVAKKMANSRTVPPRSRRRAVAEEILRHVPAQRPEPAEPAKQPTEA
ncbi:hypothetical protein ABT095_22830 [Kitasatospora sp. NPDC002227]|uniref:hypothetical protein n=1 Tax=Kitasatospora sp. NPDC002227 TaxID=3154773 RepID=UPI003324F8B1